MKSRTTLIEWNKNRTKQRDRNVCKHLSDKRLTKTN